MDDVIYPIENKSINNRKNKIIRLWRYNNKMYTIDLDLLDKKDENIVIIDISHIDGQVTIFRNLYKNMIRKEFDNMLMSYSYLKNEYDKKIILKYNISKLIFNEECLWEEGYINNYKLFLIFKSEDYICDNFKDLIKYIKKWKYKDDIKYHLRQYICNICINNKKKCYICLEYNKLIDFKDEIKCNTCIIFEQKLCSLCKNINDFNKRILCKFCWNNETFLKCKSCNISKKYDNFQEIYKCKICWY